MTRARALSALLGLLVGLPLASGDALASDADDQTLMVAQADCYAVGQQVAAQNGGTLARASQDSQGGRDVCVIVVLVPGKDGQRPRRTEIVVPLN